MDKPILDEFDRWVLKEHPHSSFAQALRLDLAITKLRRSISQSIDKLLKK